MALFPYPFRAMVNFPAGIDQEESSDALAVQPLFMNESSNPSDPPEFVIGEQSVIVLSIPVAPEQSLPFVFPDGSCGDPCQLSGDADGIDRLLLHGRFLIGFMGYDFK
jgi:hypothetical protein